MKPELQKQKEKEQRKDIKKREKKKFKKSIVEKERVKKNREKKKFKKYSERIPIRKLIMLQISERDLFQRKKRYIYYLEQKGEGSEAFEESVEKEIYSTIKFTTNITSILCAKEWKKESSWYRTIKIKTVYLLPLISDLIDNIKKKKIVKVTNKVCRVLQTFTIFRRT